MENENITLDLRVQVDALVNARVPWHEGIKHFKRTLLLRTLEVTRGNQSQAARRLKMHRNTFSRVMKETA